MTATQKPATIKSFQVVTIGCNCPKCGSPEVTQNGSYMICVNEPVPVVCEACGTTLQLPKKLRL